MPLENLELSKFQLLLMQFTMRAAQFGEMRILKQQWKNTGVKQEEGKGFEPLSRQRLAAHVTNYTNRFLVITLQL